MNNLHMNHLQKYLSTCLLALAALLGGTSPALAFHNFDPFAVLAGTAVTCTDSTVTGDVGTFLHAASGATSLITLTRCLPPTLLAQEGTVAAKAAYTAFTAPAPGTGSYATLGSTPCGTTLTGTLAGVTLAPGVYCFDAAATLTGTLTLRGSGTGNWIFKIGTTGTGALTGTNFIVTMAGGGQACNVKWWVAQAATLTTSILQGSIYAGADITVTGGILNGDALAGGAGSPTAPTGAVTLTNSIVADCSAAVGSSALPICAKPDRDEDADDEDEDHHDRDHDNDHHDRDHHKDHDRD
jgi:hypothetical protein